jgi:S-DNA-T family DNA segregation ATPase FtsK/SpoIIIE
MPRKAVHARTKKASEPDPEHLDSATVLRLIGWIVLAAAFCVVATALATYDAADAPSPHVAAHNETPVNLCGKAGAVIAHHAYHVFGIGSWVLLAGVLGYLVMTAMGRAVTHPLVRTVGLVLAAFMISCFHGLLLPNTGPMAVAPSGLLANAMLHELAPRFSTVGSFFILLAGLGIGAFVAVDRLVLMVPRFLLWVVVAIRSRPASWVETLKQMIAGPKMRRLAELKGAVVGRPVSDDEAEEAEADDELADDEEWEYVDVDEDDVDEDEDEDVEWEEVDEDEDEEDEEEADEEEQRRLTREELKEKIKKLPVRMAGGKPIKARDEDIPRTESFEGYKFPTLEMLEDPETNFSATMEEYVREQAGLLEETLQIYGIDGHVAGIESGPAITLYSIELAPGTKVAKINAISSDIARSLKAHNIRVVANMAGKSTIGIEVPNIHREKVRLKELMSGGHAKKMVLPMYLGKDAAGEPLVADLTRMPHMLIAGTTGSGKSVCMNSIIMSWLYTKRPDELKLVLVDPKMVEMSQFGDIPHLMCPVVTESSKAAAILEWAVERMEERYELLKEARVRDIASYNRLEEADLYDRFGAETEEEQARIPTKLHYMVFVVDELADLMMSNKEVEHSIVRIAQKARAVGIHLILATQRPQATVVTGLIKSNMPCRVSFKVASGMDSRIVLDHRGAELLLGQGDMMFLTPHTSEIKRAQGTLVEDSEIRTVTKFLKDVATPSFERSLLAIRSGGDSEDEGGELGERDPMFDQAVRVIVESGRGSVSLLQRRLAIGYGRASRLVDQMSAAGIVGSHKGSVAREVIITLEEWEEMKAMEEADIAGGDYAADEGDPRKPEKVGAGEDGAG